MELNKAIVKYSHDFLIVMGDFNAQTGPSKYGEGMVLGPYSSGLKRSKNGERLVNFAFENKLKILNSMYKKRLCRKWTWISPDGSVKNEIDFILSNAENQFSDVTVINKLNFNTNHRMVRTNLKTSPSKKKSKK